MRRGHVREVANKTNYTRVKKAVGRKKNKNKDREGQNKNSMGRMCCSEEEINREEAEMKQGGYRDQR